MSLTRRREALMICPATFPTDTIMISRLMTLALCLAVLGGCRDYHSHPRAADQRGLVPADQWAAYGREQAQAIAIGRAFAEAYESDTPESLARQMARAIEYATAAGVDVVTADTLGHRLTVRFPSGWRLAILPIDDGVAPDATPGL